MCCVCARVCVSMLSVFIRIHYIHADTHAWIYRMHRAHNNKPFGTTAMVNRIAFDFNFSNKHTVCMRRAAVTVDSIIIIIGAAVVVIAATQCACMCADLLLPFSAVLYSAVASTSVWLHAKIVPVDIYTFVYYKCVHIYIESVHTLANCNKSMSVTQNMLGKLIEPLSFSERECVSVCLNIFFLPPSRSNFVCCQSYLTMMVHFDECAFHSLQSLPLFEHWCKCACECASPWLCWCADLL